MKVPQPVLYLAEHVLFVRQWLRGHNCHLL